jgi:hypothetical protein
MFMRSALYKRKLSLKWLLPVLLTCAVSALAFLPAGDWKDKVVKALQTFGQHYPQEKVYLQLDKDYYAAGETIWFKGYITLQNMPATQATNLYVELLDQNGAIVQKKLFMAANAGAPGFFELPETQKPGTYQLRAYTGYMLNYDPAFLFYRTIQIFDPQKKNPVQDSVKVTDYAVQFFPEGGNMILNAPGQIAFKAIDNNGYPIKVSGTVKNNKGKEVATITTTHDGMGVFELTPAANETYIATVKSAKGQSKTFPLPATATTGASLKIFNKGARIFYQTVLGDMTDSSYNDMLLVAQMGQQLVYKADLNAGEGRISGFIPTNDLPSGIMQITLFNKDAVPMAERLAFVRQADTLALKLEPTTINIGERERSIILLKVPDSVQLNLSVSVTDADAVAVDENATNIMSSLLLTSDIKGYVYNPAWYFSNLEPETLQALDLVMMTNGWRRFSWQKIVNNEFPEGKYSYEQGITVKGTAITGGNRPTDGKIDFMIKIPYDSSNMFASGPLNEKGDFSLTGLVFPDTALIYYQANDKQKRWKDVAVKFTPHFFDDNAVVKKPYPMLLPTPINESTLKVFLATASESNKVNRSINNKMVYLKEVNVNARKVPKEESIDKRYATGMFSSDNGYSFDFTKEMPTSFNVFQFLQARVAGLNIMGDLNDPNISWRGGKPALYLNEMQTDASMISTIPVADIALVKVFRPPFMGGFGGGANGAIAIYTKRGGDTRTNDPSIKGFELFKKAGFTVVKDFYSPNYAVRKEVHALPDKRLTLYWNPSLVIDTVYRTAKIEFFNNDFSKRYRVVVEGIAHDGSIGRTEEIY